MDYPSTQMCVNDEDDEQEEEEDANDVETPWRTNKNIKVGVLLSDSETYPVHRGSNKVGRIDSCKIIIDHNTISKEHAEIEAGVGSKSTFISDLGSLNKTKLNDTILRPGIFYQLSDGDVVRFGSVKTVFQLEEKKTENVFVIPETPTPIGKKGSPRITGSTDLSFDRSLEDVSVIVGTQDDVNIDVKTSLGSTRNPSSPKEPGPGLKFDPDEDDDSAACNRQDISKLEIEKNSSVEESDEENIFDMATQQSDIHDNETQKIFRDNVDVDKIKLHPESIADLETQKFSNVPGITESHSESINDLETQLLPCVNDNEDSRREVERIQSHSCSINELETQKFLIDNVSTGSRPSINVVQSSDSAIHDVETQKFCVNLNTHTNDAIESHDNAINDLETQKVTIDDNQDSDTDPEGIFENSGDEMIDMFDAPTQLIRVPGKASPSPSKSLESGNDVQGQKNAAVVRTEEEIIQRRVSISTEMKEQIAEVPSTCGFNGERVSISHEIKAVPQVEMKANKESTLNDSIESNLNHMFDDVNESTVDEPTQILTQHLEKMLESTQSDESEFRQCIKDIANNKTTDPELSEVVISDKATIDHRSDAVDDDEYTVRSNCDKMNTSIEDISTKVTTAVVRVPKILSTQELFEDLPAVNIFQMPSKSQGRGRIQVSPLSDVIMAPASKKLKEFQSGTSKIAKLSETQNSNVDSNTAGNKSNSSKRAGSKVIVDSTEAKGSRNTKNTKPKVEDTSAKANGHKKSTVRKDFEDTRARATEPIKTETGKELPFKKRGTSIASDPRTPRKTVPEVVIQTAKIGRRSDTKFTHVTEKRSTRLSAVDNPNIPESKCAASNLIKANYDNPESPASILPHKTEASSRNKKGTGSRKINDTSLPTDESNVNTKSKARVIPGPSNTPRRVRKKPLDTRDSVSEEEVTPPKKTKISKAASPLTANDRPRLAAQKEKRKNANSREPNVSDAPDLEIKQTNSPSTRSRSARTLVKITLTHDGGKLSSTIGSANDSPDQSSLESQEIQAILGSADQGDIEAPRYRIEKKVSRKQGFKGFPKAEGSKQGDEDKFAKPIGIPEREKRQLRQSQLYVKKINDKIDNEDQTEKNENFPKTRAKKSTEVVNSVNIPKDGSSGVTRRHAVAVASTKSSHGKSPGSEKIAMEKVKKQQLPPPVIVAAESTPKNQSTKSVRNKRGVSHKESDRAEKENLVEEPPPKRGRKKAVEVQSRKRKSSEDEAKVAQSSSPLRRGRSSLATTTSPTTSSAKTKPKILFTGLSEPYLVSIIHNLGGIVTEKPNDCDVLVTDKVRRTYKFLCAMATAVPIVSIDWLEESKKKGRFLETDDFLLKDLAAEAKFGFNLRRALTFAADDKLLEGFTVVPTTNAAPPPNAEMKSIIQACGGKMLVRPPTRWPEKSLIISRQEDIINAKKMLTKAPKSVRLVSVEFILTGILRHELNFEEHKLEID